MRPTRKSCRRPSPDHPDSEQSTVQCVQVYGTGQHHCRIWFEYARRSSPPKCGGDRHWHWCQRHFPTFSTRSFKQVCRQQEILAARV